MKKKKIERESGVVFGWGEKKAEKYKSIIDAKR